MRLGHESYSLVASTSQEEFLTLFQTMVRVLGISDEAAELAKDTLNDWSEFHEDFIDSFEAFEVSDDDMTFLDIIEKRWFSKKEYINHYFRKFAEKLRFYKKLWYRSCSLGINTTQDMVETVKETASSVASMCAYLLYGEYQMDAYFASVEKDEEHVIDTIVDQATKLARYDEDYYFNFTEQMMKKYPIKLEVFDANPELEEQFMAIMGPAIIGIDSEELTLEMVKQVLSGELTVEGLIAECNKKRDDAGYNDETDAFEEQ